MLRGITADQGILLCSLSGASTEKAGRLMMELYRQDVRPDLCTQQAEGQLQFSVSAHQRQTVQDVLADLALGAEWEESWSKISMVGCGMHSIPNIKQELFSALSGHDIPYENSWLGERRCSVLVPRERTDEAVRAFHEVLLRYHSL